MKNFIECMCDGTLQYPQDLEKIEDFITQWHDYVDKTPPEEEMSLHDYLGLTWEEYALWVENPGKLYEIVENYLVRSLFATS